MYFWLARGNYRRNSISKTDFLSHTLNKIQFINIKNIKQSSTVQKISTSRNGYSQTNVFFSLWTSNHRILLVLFCLFLVSSIYAHSVCVHSKHRRVFCIHQPNVRTCFFYLAKTRKCLDYFSMERKGKHLIGLFFV